MKKALVTAILILCLSPAANAEYADQVRQQVKDTEAAFPEPNDAYFHDMGIIARKADDAELFPLLVEILRRNLFQKSEEYAKSRFEKAVEVMESNPKDAEAIINDLLKFKEQYVPSEEFLGTADGKALAADMVRMRSEALRKLGGAKASQANLIQGFQAYRKTAMFYLRTAPETADLQALSRRLGCHTGWARQLRYSQEQEFKTDYEKGSLVEVMELTLQTPATDYSNAVWRGTWTVKYKGRDGIGQAVSQATLTFKGGAYEADLLIEGARLSSTGRFNFPNALSGERRVMLIEGTKIQPELEVSGTLVPLTGCEPEAEGPAKVENKNGRVLAS